MGAGDQLKELRTRLGMTTRDVEEFSRQIAEEESNDDFHLSNAWLTQLENTASVPSIYKLYSLSVIFRKSYADLLSVFGVDLTKTQTYQLAMPLENTHVTTLECSNDNKSVAFPIRFDRGFSLDNSNLLSRMIEMWGEVPIPLIKALDIRHSLYGFIGLKDFMLHPLIKPGSFVQIDDRLKKVKKGRWPNIFDRPIYFIELRDGYTCSWCELEGSKLLLIPHPLSPCVTRQYSLPDEAEIVGRVTGVAMRLVGRTQDGPQQYAKLSKCP